MPSQSQRAPLPVYMLADHLDAVLAAGEDIISSGAGWRALVEAPGNIETFPERQRTITEDVRSLELIIIARVIKARDHARALARADARFAPIANLFASGTAVLMDAIAECGDATDEDFETGDGLVAYVRSRGLIAPDAATVTDPAQLTIDESFLIAKRLALGPLMDMAAAFLDALDAHYELFVEDDYDTLEPAPRVSRAHPIRQTRPRPGQLRSILGRRARRPAFFTSAQKKSPGCCAQPGLFFSSSFPRSAGDPDQRVKGIRRQSRGRHAAGFRRSAEGTARRGAKAIGRRFAFEASAAVFELRRSAAARTVAGADLRLSGVTFFAMATAMPPSAAASDANAPMAPGTAS